MGVEMFLKDSPFGAITVEVWLHEHDNHDWSVKMMTCTIRGPKNTEPALFELREEFVRLYRDRPAFLIRLTGPTANAEATH
jgi:hypothetical protein